MKKKLFKTAFATVCVVAAGMGCFKAYNASNQSESSMLLAENVEALSDKDGDKGGFDYTIVKEKCYAKVTGEFSLAKLRKFFAGAELGGTIDLTQFTTLYTPKHWWQDGVRLGKDCNCQCVLASFKKDRPGDGSLICYK